MIYASFLLCIIIDNIKSLFTLSLIYCVVVRRFMHLDINEDETIIAELK